MQHFMTYPTCSTAVCGADMIGRRNSRWDSNPAVTTCAECRAYDAWREAVAAMILTDRAEFEASRFEYNATH